jgi:hypothetical protein
MSGVGLVSYESSDEDDGVTATPVPAPTQVNGVKKPEQTDESRTRNDSLVDDESLLQSMVGPSMPENAINDLEEALPSPMPKQPQLNEREMIHYLTQATHPMTSIPPSPPGSPDPAIEAKFKRFFELKAKGIHFNKDLATKSSFNNPALLSTMLERFGIEGMDQYRTSLPLDIWDPTAFPPRAFKEELLRSQQEIKTREETEKKVLSASGKRTIDFTSGGTSGTSSKASTPGTSAKRIRPG